jgi:hypothetical protein
MQYKPNPNPNLNLNHVNILTLLWKLSKLNNCEQVLVNAIFDFHLFLIFPLETVEDNEKG